ncbi:MAG: YceI family protein [Pseudomonadota bacterium]
MTRFMSTAALVLTIGIASAHAEPRTYDIDPDHAAVAFKVEHIGYAKMLGQFLKTSGSFVYDEETRELGEVTVDVDAASVFSNHRARDNHIVGKDFLWVEKSPVITFRANGGEATGDATGTVTGDLTFRGETNPVTLDVTLNKAGPYPFGHKKHTLGISAKGLIKRSDWSMTYALGGIVGDEVELIIEIEAIQRDE